MPRFVRPFCAAPARVTNVLFARWWTVMTGSVSFLAAAAARTAVGRRSCHCASVATARSVSADILSDDDDDHDDDEDDDDHRAGRERYSTHGDG